VKGRGVILGEEFGFFYNLRRDEMKDDCPFRHTLAGFEPTLAIGLRLRDRRSITLNSQITSEV